MYMTEEKFNIVRLLLDKEVPVEQISKVTGFKPNSMANYKKFRTWEDYSAYKVQMVEKYHRKNTTPTVPQSVEKEVVPNLNFQQEVLTRMDSILEELIGITDLLNTQAKGTSSGTSAENRMNTEDIRLVTRKIIPTVPTARY